MTVSDWSTLRDAPATEKIKAIAANLANVAAADSPSTSSDLLAEHIAALSRPQLDGALAFLSLTAEAACYAPSAEFLTLAGSWTDQVNAARSLSRQEAEERIAETIAFARGALDDFSTHTYN